MLPKPWYSPSGKYALSFLLLNANLNKFIHRGSSLEQNDHSGANTEGRSFASWYISKEPSKSHKYAKIGLLLYVVVNASIVSTWIWSIQSWMGVVIPNVWA